MNESKIRVHASDSFALTQTRPYNLQTGPSSRLQLKTLKSWNSKTPKLPKLLLLGHVAATKITQKSLGIFSRSSLDMEPVTSAIERVKGFAKKSTERFFSCATRKCSMSSDHDPVCQSFNSPSFLIFFFFLICSVDCLIL